MKKYKVECRFEYRDNERWHTSRCRMMDKHFATIEEARKYASSIKAGDGYRVKSVTIWEVVETKGE